MKTKPKLSAQNTPPYIAYSAFLNFLNKLKDKGMPSNIDRSVMSHMSGSGQSAMTCALKSLHLITADGKPTEIFNILCASVDKNSESEFKAPLLSLLRSTYPFLFDKSIDLEKATTKALEDKFKEVTGANGSTLARCIAFFISAAKAADITLSGHIKVPKLQLPTQKSKPKGIVSNFMKKQDKVNELSIKNVSKEDMVKITVPLRDTPDG